MLAILSLVSAFSTTAHAEDTLSLEGVLQTRPEAPAAVGAGLGLRADLGSLFASAEGRMLPRGTWIGRGTAGLDVLGGSDVLDVTVGAFAGALGGLSGATALSPTVGLELGAGLHLGRVDLRFRRALGLFGPLSTNLAEDELRLGVRLGEAQRFQVFGQGVRLRTEDESGAPGVGAGLALVF